MDILTRQRGGLALTGAGAGFALWTLDEMSARGDWSEKVHFGLAALVFTFFAAILALTGPMRLRRAAVAALPVALSVAGLLSIAAARFDRVADFQMTGLPFVAAFLLGFLPLPFVIAASGRGWRDYPTLFVESWRMVVRAVAAWLFAGLVWGVVWLSDALLGIVGLGFIEGLMQAGPLAAMLTGAALGLGSAVVVEATETAAPDLVLRLLRFLALPVLGVTLLFLLALPIRGMSDLPGDLSAAAILLAIAGAAVVLVSALIDRSDAEAATGQILGRCAQALAVVMPLPVGLAIWALATRVGQHGWTPGRVFAVGVAVAMAGYGVLYLAAVLRGAGWMRRIRQANLVMAGGIMVLAALWLTPLINAEAISARSQLARYEAGLTAAGDLDVAALSGWGKAGAAAVARLEALTQEPGHEDLALRLAAAAAGGMPAMDEAPEALLEALRAVMPLQPAGAQAVRDLLLEGIPAVELQSWIDACAAHLPGGERPGCVFVVADLWSDQPGEEALVLLREPQGFIRYEGLGLGPAGVERRSVAALAGLLPDRAEGEALIAALQDAPPAIMPAPLNMVKIGGGLILLP